MAWISPWLWAFFRVLGLFTAAPVLSMRVIPRRVRVSLAFLIVLCAQPSLPDDWQGGFFCPCHGSMFDLAGRVYKNLPAPDNLEIPPHMYLSDSKLLIGEDKKA